MKEEIQKALSKGKAAGVLRLVFHDAGTFNINENTGSYLITCSFLCFISAEKRFEYSPFLLGIAYTHSSNVCIIPLHLPLSF